MWVLVLVFAPLHHLYSSIVPSKLPPPVHLPGDDAGGHLVHRGDPAPVVRTRASNQSPEAAVLVKSKLNHLWLAFILFGCYYFSDSQIDLISLLPEKP